jgi:hypothetical protein
MLSKFQALNRLLPLCKDADLLIFVDDDVRFPANFLPRYVSMVRKLDAAIAMPALKTGSYHTYPTTLEQPGCLARQTDFVESGPVVSMTRRFLNQVTPFPESNPMGWGLEACWSKVAREHGWRMAIVDACPVEHMFRPLASRYSRDEALQHMQRYLADNQLTWPQQRVLRKYPRLQETREDYLAAFPAPPEEMAPQEKVGTGEDLPLLGAIVSSVRPETALLFGSPKASVTRTFADTMSPWHGKVIQVYPAEQPPGGQDLPCQFLPTTAEEMFATWSEPVDLLLMDADPQGHEFVRRWLQTWVKTWLRDGGVAVFPGVATGDSDSRTAQAVRDWLKEQPRQWRWQELGRENGLGLLWRLGTAPLLEEMLPGSLPTSKGEKGDPSQPATSRAGRALLPSGA